jgi:MFS family permease
MLLIVLVNFIALGFTIQSLLGRINNADTRNVDVTKNPPKKNFIQMFGDIRYYILLFGTFVVVGSGYSFSIEAPSVAAAINKPDVGKILYKWFWVSAVIAILGGGIVAGVFAKLINQWLFAAAAAFSAAAGFTFVFLANSYGGFWLFLSAFFVGAATGGWWIIVPQIILDDAGPTSFESLWGFTLSVNVGGMFAFERFFYWINQKADPSKTSDCKGVGCFLVPYIVAGALCLIVGLLCFVALSKDEGSGGKGVSEKKSLRDNDKNKSSKSKDKPKEKSAEKSKAKPSKSREKSKEKK